VDQLGDYDHGGRVRYVSSLLTSLSLSLSLSLSGSSHFVQKNPACLPSLMLLPIMIGRPGDKLLVKKIKPSGDSLLFTPFRHHFLYLTLLIQCT
jgi:hypothetical protein